jgi:hypothetical protein
MGSRRGGAFLRARRRRCLGTRLGLQNRECRSRHAPSSMGRLGEYPRHRQQCPGRRGICYDYLCSHPPTFGHLPQRCWWRTRVALPSLFPFLYPPSTRWGRCPKGGVGPHHRTPPLDFIPISCLTSPHSAPHGVRFMTVNPDGGEGRSAGGGKRGRCPRTPVVAPAEYYGSVPYRWVAKSPRAPKA